MIPSPACWQANPTPVVLNNTARKFPRKLTKLLTAEDEWVKKAQRIYALIYVCLKRRDNRRLYNVFNFWGG